MEVALELIAEVLVEATAEVLADVTTDVAGRTELAQTELVWMELI